MRRRSAFRRVPAVAAFHDSGELSFLFLMHVKVSLTFRLPRSSKQHGH